MAKTLIKIAISLLVLHAAFRVGNAYWNYYRFVDALQQSAQFGERRSDKQLCEEAMGSATQYDIPIAAASLTIFRGQSAPYNCDGGGPGTASAATTQPSTQIRIEGSYMEQLQLLPGYNYPWEFKPAVKAWLRM